VKGEYNKNFSNPGRNVGEVLQAAAFTRHTYQHTTMGFRRRNRLDAQAVRILAQLFKRF